MTTKAEIDAINADIQEAIDEGNAPRRDNLIKIRNCLKQQRMFDRVIYRRKAFYFGHINGVYYYEHPIYGDESALVAVRNGRAIFSNNFEFPECAEDAEQDWRELTE